MFTESAFKMISSILACVLLIQICDVINGQLTDEEIKAFIDRGVDVTDYDDDNWLFQHNG